MCVYIYTGCSVTCLLEYLYTHTQHLQNTTACHLHIIIFRQYAVAIIQARDNGLFFFNLMKHFDLNYLRDTYPSDIFSHTSKGVFELTEKNYEKIMISQKERNAFVFAYIWLERD